MMSRLSSHKFTMHTDSDPRLTLLSLSFTHKMPATPAQAFTNLLTTLSQIVGDIVGAVSGVLYAFIHLFWTLVSAVMRTGSALFAVVTDLAQNTVAFVWGS